VVVSLLNLYTLNQLHPISDRVDKIEAAQTVDSGQQQKVEESEDKAGTGRMLHQTEEEVAEAVGVSVVA